MFQTCFHFFPDAYKCRWWLFVRLLVRHHNFHRLFQKRQFFFLHFRGCHPLWQSGTVFLLKNSHQIWISNLQPFCFLLQDKQAGQDHTSGQGKAFESIESSAFKSLPQKNSKVKLKKEIKRLSLKCR